VPKVRIVPGLAAVAYHIHTTNSVDGSRYDDVGVGLDLTLQRFLEVDGRTAIHGLVFVDGVVGNDDRYDEAVGGYFAGAGVGWSHFGETASISVSFWLGSAAFGGRNTHDSLPPAGGELRLGFTGGIDLAVRAGKVIDEIGIMGVGSVSVGYAVSL